MIRKFYDMLDGVSGASYKDVDGDWVEYRNAPNPEQTFTASQCPDCLAGRDEFEPDWQCPECRRNQTFTASEVDEMLKKAVEMAREKKPLPNSAYYVPTNKYTPEEIINIIKQ